MPRADIMCRNGHVLQDVVYKSYSDLFDRNCHCNLPFTSLAPSSVPAMQPDDAWSGIKTDLVTKNNPNGYYTSRSQFESDFKAAGFMHNEAGLDRDIDNNRQWNLMKSEQKLDRAIEDKMAHEI